MRGASTGQGNKRSVSLGVVFSLTGPYETVGRELYDGTMLAIDEVNASGAHDFILEPKVADPGGELSNYYSICEELLRDKRIQHVVGCYTSSSRKDVIPVFEKRDGLLWYPSHYEGFESCNNVIYTGASPNQHIVPLTGYMLRRHGKRAYLIGSNYIWAWENNRVMRQIVGDCSGTVEAERYLPVGALDVQHIVEDILAKRPSFIFSSLIGVTSQILMTALAAARTEHPELSADVMPVCSVTLAEPELRMIGGAAAAGHIASSVYFQSRETPENHRFVNAFRQRYGVTRVTSADAEAAYIAVKLLAAAITRADSTEIEDVKEALRGLKLDAPQGPVQIDPDNNHCYLTPALGRSVTSGQFDILWTAEAPVKPDPYLVQLDSKNLHETWPALEPAGFHQSDHTLRVIK